MMLEAGTPLSMVNGVKYYSIIIAAFENIRLAL